MRSRSQRRNRRDRVFALVDAGLGYARISELTHIPIRSVRAMVENRITPKQWAEHRARQERYDRLMERKATNQ